MDLTHIQRSRNPFGKLALVSMAAWPPAPCRSPLSVPKTRSELFFRGKSQALPSAELINLTEQRPNPHHFSSVEFGFVGAVLSMGYLAHFATSLFRSELYYGFLELC